MGCQCFITPLIFKLFELELPPLSTSLNDSAYPVLIHLPQTSPVVRLIVKVSPMCVTPGARIGTSTPASFSSRTCLTVHWYKLSCARAELAKTLHIKQKLIQANVVKFIWVSYPVVSDTSKQDDNGYGKTIPTSLWRPKLGRSWRRHQAASKGVRVVTGSFGTSNRSRPKLCRWCRAW